MSDDATTEPTGGGAPPQPAAPTIEVTAPAPPAPAPAAPVVPPPGVVPVASPPPDRAAPSENAVWGAVVVAVWLILVLIFAIRFGSVVYDELGKFDDLSDSQAARGVTFTVSPVLFDITFTDASQNLLVAMVAASGGMFGAFIFAARGFAIHFARNEFGASWVPWYFVRIFVGAILGVFVVFAVAAGLITGGAGSGDVEASGVAILAFIAGLASKKAIDKFETLIDVIFGEPDPPSVTDQVAAIRKREAAGEITAADATALVKKLTG